MPEANPAMVIVPNYLATEILEPQVDRAPSRKQQKKIFP